MGQGPGAIPKIALTTARIVDYPFEIPAKFTNATAAIGMASASLGGANAAIGTAYMKLEPKGPAKWLVPLFTKFDAASKASQAKAERNYTVFWKPMSDGVSNVGQAIANPGAYYYAKKAGFDLSDAQKSADLLRRLVHRQKGDPRFPAPAPAGPATPPDTGSGGGTGGTGDTGGGAGGGNAGATDAAAAAAAAAASQPQTDAQPPADAPQQ